MNFETNTPIFCRSWITNNFYQQRKFVFPGFQLSTRLTNVERNVIYAFINNDRIKYAFGIWISYNFDDM